MKKSLKIILYIAGIILIALIGLTVWFISVTKDAYLDEEKLTDNLISINLFYSDGSPLLDDEEGRISLKDTPKHLQNAFIAIEDKRFFQHNGIDLKSILRALKNDLTSLSAKEGGSTISQQLVKNLYLSNEKTIERKLKELKLTLLLENKLTKEEILEKYLNTVYFGEGAYGIKKAAKIYFGKKPKDLTEDESALLAAIVKAPSYYDPYINLSAAKKRRDLVLDEMAKENYLSQSIVKQLKNNDIYLNNTNNYNYNSILRKDILKETSLLLGISENQLKNINVYCSLNNFDTTELPTPDEYGINVDFSEIIIDNKDSTVKAYKSTVGEIKRTPASTVKPWLIYAPALEEKIVTEATKINDEPTDFNGYKPRNSSDEYYGLTSVRDCLSKSLNIPSVKILNSLGIDKAINYAKKMNIGISNRDGSIALGNINGGLTLREIASAYLPFSTDGYYSKASLIDKITDEKGKIIYSKKTNKIKVFSSSTSYIINDALKLTSETGTTKKLKSLDFAVQSKTGTNGNANGNFDAYCIAYTPEYTVAVWLGRKDGKKMPNEISGGSYPTVLAADILSDIYKTSKPSDFTKPQSVIKVKVNSEQYEKNGKIYLSNGDITDPEFYFTLGTEPKTVYKERTPQIYDYKVIYKKPYIKFEVDKDDNFEFEINDLSGNIIYDSMSGLSPEILAKENEVYYLYLTPYRIENGKKIHGKKINLPSVNTRIKKYIFPYFSMDF